MPPRLVLMVQVAFALLLCALCLSGGAVAKQADVRRILRDVQVFNGSGTEAFLHCQHA